MYFTLAISAAPAERGRPRAARGAGPSPRAWQDGPTAVLCWPEPDGATGRSHAGTIWADDDGLYARTGVTRVDPVYQAEVPGAVLVSDRASWAAAVAGRLAEPDPVMAAA